MDQILLNRQYRNLFFLSAGLLATVALLVRYYLLPTWNPSLALKVSSLIALLLEGFISTLVVTIAIGCYLFFATPRVMQKAKLEALEPHSISSLLRRAAQEAQEWQFRGGMGRFTRSETLPTLAKQARRTNSKRRLSIQILDPDNSEACQSYALYRAGLKSATNKQFWTSMEVRKQLLTTLLKASLTAVDEPMLDVTVHLSGYWSVWRVDLSSKYVILTREDSEAPGVRADEGTVFYQTYVSDLHFSASQSRTVPKLPPFTTSDLSDVKAVRNILAQLDVRHNDLDDSFVLEVARMTEKSSHQYE